MWLGENDEIGQTIAIAAVGLGAIAVIGYLIWKWDPLKGGGKAVSDAGEWVASGVEYLARTGSGATRDTAEWAAGGVEWFAKGFPEEAARQRKAVLKAGESLWALPGEKAHEIQKGAEAFWKGGKERRETIAEAPGRLSHEIQKIRLPEVKLPKITLPKISLPAWKPPKWKPPWEGAKSTLWGMEIDGIITLP